MAVRNRQAKLADLSLHALDMRRRYPDWAINGRGKAPLKFLQVSSFARLQLVRNRLEETVPWTFIDPLIYKPLIELCLQIPSETLCVAGIIGRTAPLRGGNSAAIALSPGRRTASANALPLTSRSETPPPGIPPPPGPAQ